MPDPEWEDLEQYHHAAREYTLDAERIWDLAAVGDLPGIQAQLDGVYLETEDGERLVDFEVWEEPDDMLGHLYLARAKIARPEACET